MSSATTFTRRIDAHSRCVRHSAVDLPGGVFLTINAARTGMVELGVSFSSDLSSHQTCTAFTPDQARALAAELLACADAFSSDAVLKGGAL